MEMYEKEGVIGCKLGELRVMESIFRGEFESYRIVL
jgi:hypothetical protein